MTNAEKLASPKRLFIFFREDGFYPLEIPEATVADCAECNPGTLRVEDAVTREIVWQNEDICPDCEKLTKPKKSWGGMLACYCLWDGRKPSMKQLEELADDPGLYERKRAIMRERLGLSADLPNETSPSVDATE